MLYNLPSDIIDKIFELSGYKIDIQKYFKENIATKIDITIKQMPNGCELCYINNFKKGNKKCLRHSMMENSSSEINKKKYLSLYNLPNGKFNNTLGRLFLAIDDIQYFIQILSNTNKFGRNKLGEIHNELLEYRN